MSELPKQTGFSHPRFADQRNDLAVAKAGLLKGLSECFQFTLSAHEASKTPHGSRLHSRAQTRNTLELIDFNRLHKSAHWDWAQRRYMDKSLRQSERGRSKSDRPRRCE